MTYPRFPPAHPPRQSRPEPTPEKIVRIVAVDAPHLRVLGCCDMDIVGFCVETSTPVVPGLRARFEFRSGDGLLVTIRAIAVHAHSSGGRHSRYFSSWEFLSDEETDLVVDLLVESAQRGRHHWPGCTR